MVLGPNYLGSGLVGSLALLALLACLPPLSSTLACHVRLSRLAVALSFASSGWRVLSPSGLSFHGHFTPYLCCRQPPGIRIILYPSMRNRTEWPCYDDSLYTACEMTGLFWTQAILVGTARSPWLAKPLLEGRDCLTDKIASRICRRLVPPDQVCTLEGIRCVGSLPTSATTGRLVT